MLDDLKVLSQCFLARQAALLCTGRTAAALPHDPQRAAAWLRRWLLLQALGSTVEPLLPRMPRSWARQQKAQGPKATALRLCRRWLEPR